MVSPLPHFSSHDIHPRLRQFVEPIELLTDACVRECVGHTEPTKLATSRRKKKSPFSLRTLTCLSFSVVIKGERWPRGSGGCETERAEGERGERAEVAGQGTQSSGIKPSRLLPTSREFSPFSASNPRPLPSRASLR